MFCLLVVLVELSVLAKWLARNIPLRKPNRVKGIVSRKPRPKSVHDFLGLLYCFIVLLCICVVSCPYVIYYPTVMAQYGLFVLKVPLNPKQTNKRFLLLILFSGSLTCWKFEEWGWNRGIKFSREKTCISKLANVFINYCEKKKLQKWWVNFFAYSKSIFLSSGIWCRRLLCCVLYDSILTGVVAVFLLVMCRNLVTVATVVHKHISWLLQALPVAFSALLFGIVKGMWGSEGGEEFKF